MVLRIFSNGVEISNGVENFLSKYCIKAVLNNEMLSNRLEYPTTSDARNIVGSHVLLFILFGFVGRVGLYLVSQMH